MGLLAVTRGGPITGVLAHVRGEELLTAINSYAVGNCSLTELQVDGERVSIERAADQLRRHRRS